MQLTYGDEQNGARNKFKLLAVILGVVVLGCLALLLVQSLRFHLVSTTPGLKKVGISTPYIAFNFNHPLSSSGLSVSSPTNTVSSFTVSGKSLIVELAPTISIGKTYTITIGALSSTSGKRLAAATYSFTVQDIPLQGLPKSQQQAVLKQQATPGPYARVDISFTGTSSLLDNGITANQVEAMEQAFYLYSVSIGKQFSQVSITAGSVTMPPYDPDNPPVVSTTSFTGNIDGRGYDAKLAYSGLSTAELYLYDAHGVQIYDSGPQNPGDPINP